MEAGGRQKMWGGVGGAGAPPHEEANVPEEANVHEEANVGVWLGRATLWAPRYWRPRPSSPLARLHSIIHGYPCRTAMKLITHDHLIIVKSSHFTRSVLSTVSNPLSIWLSRCGAAPHNATRLNAQANDTTPTTQPYKTPQQQNPVNHPTTQHNTT